VLMPEQGADILAHFGDQQFLTRYQRFQAHIAEWRQQYPRLASVDLRYDRQVVLQMAGESDAQKTIAGGDAVPAGSAAVPPKPSPDGKAEAAPQAKAPAAPQHKAHIAKSAHRTASERKKRKHPDYSRAGLTHHKSNHSSTRQGQ